MADTTIHLSVVMDLLDDAHDLCTGLNGRVLDERLGGTREKDVDKLLRVERSRELQELASKLELAAALARHEYFVARGATDPINNRK